MFNQDWKNTLLANIKAQSSTQHFVNRKNKHIYWIFQSTALKREGQWGRGKAMCSSIINNIMNSLGGGVFFETISDGMMEWQSFNRNDALGNKLYVL